MIGQKQRIVWPGGEHDFCFHIGELRALEQRLGSGVAVVLARLFSTQFKIDDIHETLRLGLQGGGMSEREAVATIERSYPMANLVDLSVTASRVLAMFVSWPTGEEADDPSGEATAATTSQATSSPSQTDASAGPGSSAPLQ